MTEHIRRPLWPALLAGLMNAAAAGGGAAMGTVSRKRYYDPGKNPAPRKLIGARFGKPKNSDRQAKLQLRAEMPINSGRQWRKLKRELRRQEKAELALRAARALHTDEQTTARLLAAPAGT